MKQRDLTPEETAVIVGKGTEPPGTGEYLHWQKPGLYTCKRCGARLYRSGDKFNPDCGWPAFDDAIAGAVRQMPDPDGSRTEIVCAACGGHLGHVFRGEGFTPKNARHCVNSLSLVFIPETETGAGKAYFAAGCFWGVEYWFKREAGVEWTAVGYMGGDGENPTYEEVCSGATGHAETLEVAYDSGKTSFDQLCRLFFEIHDFTQANGQGPDIGGQYRSEIFAIDPEQEQTARRLLAILIGQGFKPVTRIARVGRFWPAEDYHQDYYGKTGKTPYCHNRREIFRVRH